MTVRFAPRSGALGVLLLVAGFGPAFADAIDGDWCDAKGRQLSIHGPAIVTPGGTASTGSYGRHAFSYVTPAGEPGAGDDVSMRLVNEERMNLTVGNAASAPVEVWNRCPKPVS